jgi:HPt (histidine-containing phosphotransfer) domain-containing protein
MTAASNGTHREIEVDDNFGLQARSPGGLSRDDAIKRAHVELTQLKPQLEEHLKQQCQQLEAALLAARTHDEKHLAHIADAYAASLSLPEIADSIGYALVGFIAANLCTIIETADEARMDYPAAVIDCHCDALRLALSPSYLGKQLRDLPELAAGLSQTVRIAKVMAERIAASAAPAPPAAKAS